MGMSTLPGTVTLAKDPQNLIGISIGGGAPLCPCLYVVQVFDHTPASKDGTLQSGDEITAINCQPVKGKTKVEVARMIQAVKGDVTISYNKITCDTKQGRTLDIVVKKIKHRMVENMSSSTADALGLSRAILCNDGLVKKLQELERNAHMYQGIMDHMKSMLCGYYKLTQSHRRFGDIYYSIGVREPQASAGEALRKFGEAHQGIEKMGVRLIKTLKPMVSDLNTYLNKAIPDTKLTIKRYLDIKFEYLSYCLKVKEMDDEEYSYAALGEPLYRVETGNYEYRLVLRCRQDARCRFAKLRSDVLEKMELLDVKHVQDIVYQMQRLVSALGHYHQDCVAQMKDQGNVFPIEVDLLKTTMDYGQKPDFSTDGLLEDEDVEPEEMAVAGELVVPDNFLGDLAGLSLEPSQGAQPVLDPSNLMD